MRFIQITASVDGIYALDELGRLWMHDSYGWWLLGDADAAMAEVQSRHAPNTGTERDK